MRFSQREKKDLFYAGIMISLAFAVLLSGGFNIVSDLNFSFIIIFLIAVFTGGMGFLLHELMHKYVAHYYGLRAEFKAFYNMLWLALAFSFFGFIFAAPGAVMIYGNITREKNGKISLAGPMTNIVLALIFLMLTLIFKGQGVLNYFFNFGLTINSLLAAFNMIPIAPFDGSKILSWDKKVYIMTTIFAVGLFVVRYFI